MTEHTGNLIVDRDHPALRQVSLPVPEEMFGTPKLKKLIEKMKVALSREDDGVALAAPQIGENLRIFIVSGKIFGKEDDQPASAEGQTGGIEDLVFINPILTKTSRKKKQFEEGCLSIRYLYGKIERSEKATVSARDEEGNRFEIGGKDLLAQIFQHEIDHLDGILFTDNAEDVVDMPPEESSND